MKKTTTGKIWTKHATASHGSLMSFEDFDKALKDYDKLLRRRQRREMIAQSLKQLREG